MMTFIGPDALPAPRGKQRGCVRGAPARSNSDLARFTNEVFPDPHGPRTPTTTPSDTSRAKTLSAKDRAASDLFSVSSSTRRIGLSLRSGRCPSTALAGLSPDTLSPPLRSPSVFTSALLRLSSFPSQPMFLSTARAVERAFRSITTCAARRISRR